MPLPKFTPIPLARLPQPFDHPDWIFELKYDGFRALAHLEAGTVRLVSRNRNVFKSFPDLGKACAACIKAESAVLDGEIVYLGGDGRPEFYSLMRRRAPQHFYAFDILWLEGKDLRGLPLVERKQILRNVVPVQPAPVLYVEHGHAWVIPRNGRQTASPERRIERIGPVQLRGRRRGEPSQRFAIVPGHPLRWASLQRRKPPKMFRNAL